MMKLKMIVVDLELSARAKRIAAGIIVPLFILGGAAVAYAGGLHSWNNGDTLTAADLNDNFSNLQDQINGKQVPIATEWQQFTPVMRTAAGAAVAGVETLGRYRRVGDSAEIVISTFFSGTPTPSGTYYQWTIPAGLTIDMSKVPGSTQGVNTFNTGAGDAAGPNVGQLITMVSYIRSPTTLSASPNGNWYITDSVPYSFGAGYSVELTATVPIQGWSVTQ